MSDADVLRLVDDREVKDRVLVLVDHLKFSPAMCGASILSSSFEKFPASHQVSLPSDASLLRSA